MIRAALTLAASFLLSGVLSGLLAGCGSSEHARDGLDPSRFPADVRADYEVFARRCSKCHSLSRPLNSGIDDDAYWAAYVARMRRQPSSGISHQDELTVLRFLHFYSLEQKQKKLKGPPPPVSEPAPAPSPSPIAPDGGT
jgi:hypothetical protein